MPTYPSPVSLEEFQFYLNDNSTDDDVLDFYTSLLETATELVYKELDRDYTPEALHTDTFRGDGSHVHVLGHPAASIEDWISYDTLGQTMLVDPASLVI